MKRVLTTTLLLSLYTFAHTAAAVEKLDPVVVIAEAESSIESDPLEGYNRAMFSFNESLDNNLMKPVAEHPQQPAAVQAGRGGLRYRPLRHQQHHRYSGLL